MGTVYKALDEEVGDVVALKILDPQLADNPILVERFKREARHAAILDHKNIVTLYEADEVDGMHYLAMEYIDGIDLAEYIRRKGKLDPEEARRILIQACKGLEHAFAQGITHRDIKPSNFLLANEEGHCRVKLTDLGLARMSHQDDFQLTRAGTTVGTVDYMAPEQARDSKQADVRSDIYSLGCTFYHMLAGQPPFSEGGLGERVYAHIVTEPEDVRVLNPRVNAGLWTVLRRMLAKHPDDRFQTPEELIHALRSVAGPGAYSQQLDVDPESDGDLTPTPAESADTYVPRRRALEPPSSTTLPAARQAVPAHPTANKQRKTTVPELKTVPDPSPDLLGITPEQRNAASGQFARATEVIRNGGDSAYAIQLLLSCCKLDPGNLMYRKTLREIGRKAAGGKRGWFGSLTNLPARGRLRAARNAGDHRKVLEEGEELLTRMPGDISTQIDLGIAAESLGLHALASWMLEEARLKAPNDVTLLRAYAHLLERQKRLNKAISVWEQIRQLDPTNGEASSKIKDLAASDTIARGKFLT
jgi:serine/threonine protein kinase